jgi:hypothetical protein
LHDGRFHHGRLCAGRDEPVGNALQIAGKPWNICTGSSLQIWTHGNIVEL